MSNPQGELPFRYASFWLGALVCFVVAGSTGVLYRAGLLFGLPGGLDFGNVRHAHSHLMYFGWVTPVIMAMLAQRLPSSRRMQQVIYTLLILAGLAYVPFLLYGYGLAAIGPLRLPLSVILATANMVGWYVFTALYVRQRAALASTPARWFWDAALTFLVIASLGAWGLGLVQALRPDNPVWFVATLHLFLDLFADGWLVLAVLGFAVDACAPAGARSRLRWSWRLLVGGLPVMFLLSIPIDLLSPAIRWIGSAGAVGSAVGLVIFLRALGGQVWRAPMWRLPLALLALKAMVHVGLAMPVAAQWGLDAGLRIPYLHVVLLGVVTLGLLAAAKDTWSAAAVPGWSVVQGSVVFLLVSLMPLTGLWPGVWSGRWVLWAALGGALAPTLAMTMLLGRSAYWRLTSLPRPIQCDSAYTDEAHTTSTETTTSLSLS
jgi:hypothetical protein